MRNVSFERGALYLLSDILARGTYTARICDNHQAIGPADTKEEACEG
jgi:hypothetical protein